jgi:hypothetical protein
MYRSTVPLRSLKLNGRKAAQKAQKGRASYLFLYVPFVPPCG